MPLPEWRLRAKTSLAAETSRQIETLPLRLSMSRKGHQRSDRHAEGFDLFGAAEIRQIDYETRHHHEDWGRTAS